MGRTTGTFMIHGTTPEHVFQVAHTFGSQKGFKSMFIGPGCLSVTRGDEWVNGRKVIEVFAQPVQGGTMVTLQGYVTGVPWGELDANPRAVFGMLPRKKMWKMLVGLAQALGVRDAGPAFQHS